MEDGAELRQPIVRARGRRTAAVSLLIVFSLVATLVAVDPASATSTTSSSTTSTTDASTPATTKSDRPDAPVAAHAIATPAGTEVRWDAAPSNAVAPEPTGWLVVGCGPYAHASAESAQAARSACLGEASAKPVRVATDVRDAVVACVPTATEFCVLAVFAEVGDVRSASLVVGSGGTPPNAPLDPVVVAAADGHSLELSWTPGADAVQVGTIPPIPQTWEVSRGDVTIARDLTEPRFIDDACGVAARCAYSVRATSPAGRSAAAVITSVTAGTAAPTIDIPDTLLVPGTGSISGSAGHGRTDARPIELALRGETGDITLPAAGSVDAEGRWSQLVPASVAPGFYRVVARQAGFETISSPIAVAADHALAAGVDGVVSDAIATVAAPNVVLGGAGVTSPPGSSVEVVDHWGYALPATGSPSQDALGLAVTMGDAAHRSGSHTATVAADGSWSLTLPVDRSESSVHIVSVTQTVPGVRVSTRYVTMQVLAPVLRPTGGQPEPTDLLGMFVSAQTQQQNQIPTPPPAPTGLSAVAGDGSATLSWIAPVGSAWPITRYTASVVGAASSACVTDTTLGAAPATSCTITGLSNRTSYTFIVVARSLAGDSVPSAASAAVTPAARPSAPTGVVVVAAAGQATVRWNDAVSPDSPVLEYLVATTSQPKRSCTFTVPGSGASGNSCIVSGLINGTAYAFTVTARNDSGYSSASIATDPVTPVAPPEAPTAVGGTAAPSAMKVTWTPGADNGSPILSYRVMVIGRSTPVCVVLGDEAGLEPSCLVKGLVNGVSYRFSVIARNALGDSPAASTSSPVVPADVPTAPNLVRAVARPGSAVVSWMNRSANGAPITSFTVTAVEDPNATCTSTALVGLPTRNCTVRGLVNGGDYTFVVTAANSAGTSSASLASDPVHVASAPDAPADLAVTAGDTTATVSWTLPSDNGSPITSYQVRSTQLPVRTCTATIPASGKAALSCEITGLANGVGLNFVVTATNALGTSPASAPSPRVVPAALPGAPFSVTASLVADSAIVQWVPGAANGAPVTAYVVTAVQDPSKTCTSVALLGVARRSCVVTGLEFGSPYSFTVVANNAMGSSTPSIASDQVLPATVPDAPTTVTAVADDRAVVVSWNDSITHGAPVTSYLVAVVGSPLRNCTITAPFADGRTCRISGLVNGVGVRFSVVAISAIGASSPSGPTAVVTPAAVPSAPLVVTALAVDARATVSWSASNANGAPITGYTATAVEDPTKQCATSALVGTPARSCTITGLTNGNAYTFVVSASNRAGTSLVSTASVPVVPVGPPAAPASVVAVAGPGAATIRWVAPSANGSPILSYVVTTTDMPRRSCSVVVTSPATELACTVIGLTNGTSYAFTVRAVNLLGASPSSDPSDPVMPASVPGMPLSITASADGGSATITWTEAPTGGSPILSYTVATLQRPVRTCVTVALLGAPPTSCVIDGLTVGQLATFRVQAVNAFGVGRWSAVSAPVLMGSRPSAPSGVVAVRGNQELEVRWDAAVAADLPVTSYVVQAVGAPALTCTAVIDSAAAARSCIVRGLTNGTSYSFTVRAINAIGASTASSASAAVVPGSVPDTIAAPDVIGGPSSVTVSWSTPADNGLTIDHYTVVADGDAAIGCTYEVPVSGDPLDECTISGLEAGRTLRFLVRAHNAAGDSLDSELSAPITVATVDAPPSATATDGTNGRSFITWTAPNVSPGDPILGYAVTSSPEVAPPANCIDTRVLWCRFTGLQNGTTYTFEIRARTASGLGLPAIVVAQPQPEAPRAPATISAFRTGTSVDLSWGAAVDNGSPVISYRVTSDQEPERACTYVLPTDGAPELRRCTIDGLDPAVAYTFSVVATNAVGQGQRSVSTAPVTAPDVPTAVLVSRGAGTVTVSWSPASGHGSAPTYLARSIADPTRTCVTAGLSCTITGLSIGMSQSFEVLALNEAGTSEPSDPSDAIVPALAPAAPSRPIVSLRSGAFAVAWDSVWSPWAEVTSYTATASPGDLSCTTTDTSCTIDGLTTGVTYDVTVTAANELGAGIASPAATVQAVGPTAAPTDVLVSVSGSFRLGDSIDVTWTIPEVVVAGPYEWSTVDAVAADGSSTRVCTTAIAATLSGSCRVEAWALTLGVPVSFVVRAQAGYGESPTSVPSEVVTPLRTPTAPTGAGVELADTVATISWDAVLGEGVSSYTVTSPQDATLSCTVLVDDSTGDRPSCGIGGLSLGATRTFVVTATNAIATGSASTPTDVVTPARVPEAPRSVGDAVHGTRREIRWIAPSANGSAITSYRAEVVGDPSLVCESVALVGPAATHCTIDDVDPTLAIAVTVTATNAVGTSAASIASEDFTYVAAPDAPTGVTFSEGRVSWTAPEANGSPITSYVVTAVLDPESPAIVPDWIPLAPSCTYAVPVDGPSLNTCTITSGLPSSPLYYWYGPYRFDFVVRAVNAVGTSPVSSRSPGATAALPGRPTSLTAKGLDGHITATWSPPASNDIFPVTRYDVRLQNGTVLCSVVPTADITAPVSCRFAQADYTSIGIRVASFNAFGQSADQAWTTVETVPSPPVVTTVQAVAGNAAATVTWTDHIANPDWGGAVYTVTSVEDPTKSCTIEPYFPRIGDYTERCTVADLTPGLGYSFVVTSADHFGNTAVSPRTAAVLPYGVPGAPVGVVAHVRSEDVADHTASMVISWDSAPANGSAVTGYAVRSTTSPERTCTTSATSCEIAGLANGVEHSFIVTATNAAGAGTPSEASEPVLSAVAPSAPIGVDATVLVSRSAPSITVSWDAPNLLLAEVLRGNGAAIDHYTVTAVEDPSLTCTTTSVSCDITGVTNGSTYTFIVTATNAIGTGDASSPTAGVTPAAAPEAPTDLTAVSTDSRITIGWTAADSNGSPVTSYVVTDVDDPEHGCTYVVPAAGTPAQSCTISALVNGVAHSFTVVAVNAVGTSEPSAASPSAVPTAAPGVVTDIVAVPGPASVAVSWTGPVDDGGSPISRVSVVALQAPQRGCAVSGAAGTEADGSCVVTGLANGTAYTFAVSASNAVGAGPVAISSEHTSTRTGSVGTAADAVSVDGTQLWIADAAANTVRAVNPSSGVLIRTIPVGHADNGDPLTPRGIVSDGTYLWVTNDLGSNPYMDAERMSTITQYRADTGAFVRTIAVPWNPNGIASDGRHVWVTGLVHMRRTHVWNVAYPDAFQYQFVEYRVAEIDANTGAYIGSTRVGPPALRTSEWGDQYWAYPRVDTRSTVSTDGTSVWVANIWDDSVTQLDASTGVVIRTIGVGGSPSSISSDGSNVWVTNSTDATVTQISAVTGAVVRTIPVGASPSSVVSDGGFVWVANTADDTVTQLSASTGAVLRTLATGDAPSSIAVRGTEVWVGNAGSSDVTEIHLGVVPADVPDAPTGVRASYGDRRATVAWDPASSNGSTVVRYRVTTAEDPSATCTVDIASAATARSCAVTGLTNGSSYTFTVTAENAVGEGDASAASLAIVPAAAPSAPTEVVATRGDRQASVTWTAASDNGAPIQSYRVTVVGDSALTCVSVPAAGLDDGCVITGLTNGVARRFMVTATNSAGTSAASAASAPVVPAAVPDPVPNAVAVRGDQSVTVSWTAPEAHGATITSYRASVTGDPTASCVVEVVPGVANSCVISSLTDGVAVTVDIVAVNEVGTSPVSTTNAVTPAGVPAVPTAVVGTSGPGSVTVSWTPGASNGAPIESYVVTAVGSPLRTCTVRVALRASNSCVVDGLTNGIEQTFTVAAVNAVGVGADSLASEPIAPRAPPAAPTSITAVVRNAGATVSWVPSASNGSPITSFSAWPADDPTLVCTVDATADTSNSCVIDGLENGTSHSFVVTATNAVGEGAPSAPSSSVRIAAAPDAPSSVSAIAGDRRVTVRWTPGSSNGSAITEYRVVSTADASLTCDYLVGDDTGESCVVSGLLDQHEYSFTVVAMNALGASESSAPSAAVAPDVAPGSPLSVAAVAGDGTATITWSAPVSNGSAIRSYSVQVAGDATHSCVVLVGEPLSCTIEGLTNGVAVAFAVAAVNDAGSSDAATSSEVTPSGLPATPVITNIVVPDGMLLARVAFDRPDAGGSAITAITVHVLGHPELSCSNSGATLGYGVCVVFGLEPGASNRFVVTATNANGSTSSAPSAAFVSRSVPDAPSSIVATPSMNGATVSWVEPDGNGSPVTAIEVTATFGGLVRGCRYVIGVDSGDSCAITGLRNQLPYDIAVVARNDIGTGDAALSSVLPAGAPDAPTDLWATAGDGTATVHWQTPATNGSEITSYVVTAIDDDSLTCTAGVGAGLYHACEITSLVNGSTYRFSVVAHSAAGPGAAALTSTVRPAGRPGSPTEVSAVAGESSATVSWAPAPANGSPIDSYVARVVGSPLRSCTHRVGVSLGSACVIPGLTDGVEHSFVVIAHNALGDGDASAASGPVTPRAPPTAPVGVVALRGDHTATVSWSASDPRGSAITSYEVTAVGDTSKTCVADQGEGDSLSCVVTGLDNATELHFVVVAINAIGRSAASAASAAVTIAGVPDAPGDLVARVGDTSASIAWSAPSSNGSAITGYVVTELADSTLGCSTTDPAATSCSVSGLTNGAEYSFVAIATNAVGDSAPSAASAPVVPAGAPGAATSLVVTAASHRLEVSWATADANGSPITGYVARLVGDPSASCSVIPPAALQCAIDGVENDVAHRVEVIATNLVGSGLATSPSDAVVASDVPDAPTVASVSILPRSTTAVVAVTRAASGSPASTLTVRAVDDHSLTCTATWSSGTSLWCEVIGLGFGQSHRFESRSSNAVGDGAWSTASAPVAAQSTPGAPSSVGVTVSATSATVSWTAPADNGSPITSTLVRASRAGAGIVATCSAAADAVPADRCTLVGLTSGETFVLSVTATNALGSGDAATSSVVAESAPDAPGSVVATRGDSSATVQWTAPNANGRTIESYSVVVEGDDSHRCTVDATAVSDASCTIAGLVNGTAYRFLVTAVNALGESPSARTSSVTPAAAPSAPTIVSTTKGRAQVAVAWTTGAANGAPIESFIVRVVGSPSRSCTYRVGLSVGNTCTVTGLTNGTAYSFEVLATNAVGTSVASAASAAVSPSSPFGAPDTPLDVTASIGDGSITVRWTTPPANGNRITVLAVTSVADPAVGCTYRTDTNWGDSCTVSGLTNGTAYRFRVTATNAIGTSDPSPATPAVTPMPTPAQVAGVVAIRGDRSVALSWAPADGRGSAITAYVVTEQVVSSLPAWARPAPRTCMIAQPLSGPEVDTCTVTGLTNGNASRFSVHAVSASGSGPESVLSLAVTPAGVPAAPGLRTSLFDRSAYNVWVTPDANGSPLTKVQVRAVEDATKVCERDLTELAYSACTIDGLDYGAAVTFEARFANAVGFGPWSAPTEVLTPLAAPSSVLAASVAKGFRQLSITWTAPDSNGSPITSYTATAVKRGHRFPSWSTRPWDSRCESVLADGGSTSCVLTGLDNGDTYDVSITAANAIGSSWPVVVSGVPAAVPSAASAMPVSADSSLIIGWVPPASNGSAITSYTATAVGEVTRSCVYYVGTNPWMVETNRCVIAGLTNGTTYAVTVTARNSDGISLPASAVPATPARIADLPTSIVAVPGPSAATVSWTRPASDGGAPITAYTAYASRASDANPYVGARYSWISPAATCTVTVPVSGPEPTSCAITGLTNGVPYVFSVAATNRAGTTAESVLSSSVIPVARPSAPSVRVYPAANGSVSVSIGVAFEEAITSTTVTAIERPASSCTVVHGYCDITGLEYGRAYTFSGVSTNSAGSGAVTIAGPLTLEAPPASPSAAAALVGSNSTTVAFQWPAVLTDEVVASVVGDPSKSCTWTWRSGAARVCTIAGLTSPESLTYQVVSRSYRLGSSSPTIATNVTAPVALSVAGFTAGASGTPTSTMSIADGPVLRGTAALPSIPGVAAAVTLDWIPTGAPSWFTGTAGSVAHSVSAPVAADGTWSYALPSNFPEGTFVVNASQGTPLGTLTNTAGRTLYTVAPSPVTPTSVFLRSSGATSEVLLTGAMPTNRTVSSITAAVSGGAQSPCTAVVSGSSWTCTLRGVPTTGSVQFDITSTTSVWSASVCTMYSWGCYWTYPTRPQSSITSTTRLLAVAATRPAITSPGTAVFGPGGVVTADTVPLLTGFAVSGTASTDPSMRRSVIINAYSGNAVTAAPTTSFTADVSDLGAYSTPLALADGTWTLEVAQASEAGVLRAGAPVTVLVDSAAPTIALGVPAAGTSIPSGFVGGTITHGWGGESSATPATTAALTLRYHAGATATGSPTLTRSIVTCGGCGGQFADAPSLTPGVWTVQVSAASRTGVVGTATRTFTVATGTSAGFDPKVTLTESNGAELTSAGQQLDTTSCGRSYQLTCDDQLPVAGTQFIGVRVGSAAGRAVGPIATGTVTLFDGSTSLGTRALVDGATEFSVELLVQSSAHQLRATYTGSDWYAAGASDTAPFRVKGARPSASIVPIYPTGSHNPGSLQVSLTYTGPRGITEYCNYPNVDVYSSMKRTSAGGVWSGGVFTPRPLIENFAQNQARQRIASGPLLGGAPGTVPSGPGTIASTSASIWGYTDTLFTFWVASSGDDRCAPTNGTDYFNDSQLPRDITTPVATDVTILSTAYAARATVPTVIAPGATLGTTSTYTVGTPVSTAVSVCSTAGSFSNERRDQATYQSACSSAGYASVPKPAGVPVYLLDADGRTVGDPVLTDSNGRAMMSWTPTSAGWIIQRFQVGASAPDGMFRGTRGISVTVPVEPGTVNLAWTQTPSTFAIGAAAQSTIDLGSPNLVGTLSYRDHSPSLSALQRPNAAANSAPAPWTTAPLTCVITCRSTVDMPKTLRVGSPVLGDWWTHDPTDTPTLIKWWTPQYAGSSGRSLSLDHQFVSAATGLTYTLNTNINRRAPQPLAMNMALVPSAADIAAALPAGQVPRDQMQTVHLTVANSIPDQWIGVHDDGTALGTVELTATPDCSGAAYCTNAVTTSRFDLASSNGSPTVVHSYGDSRIPAITAAMAYSGHDATLTVDAQVFIGGMAFTVTATYTPPTNPAVGNWFPVTASSTTLRLRGVGPAPISLFQGSATMSGGSCTPAAYATGNYGRCTASDVSPMAPVESAADPRPGQTVYIKVQCDLELCSPDDMAIKYDLAESQPGLDPSFFTDPNSMHLYEADYPNTAGGVWTSTASPRTLHSVGFVQRCSYGGCRNVWTGRGQSPFSCEMCDIYPIASLSDAEANAGGGLQVGTSLVALIGYDPAAPDTLTSGSTAELAARNGRLVSFPITVAPLETQTSTQISRTGDVVNVMHAARWSGMAPLVQATPSAVSTDVYLRDASGNETQIAYCYLDGFCASKRLDGTALPSVEARTVGGGLVLAITLPGIAWAVRMAGSSIHVETSSNWGTTVDSGAIPLSTSAPARATSGAFSVSATGEWQGAVLGNPDISSPLFGWEFSSGVESFFSSLFGESAAKVLTMITTELITMAIETAIMGPFMAEMAVARAAVRVAATIAEKAAAAAKAVRATLGITKTARVVQRGRVVGAMLKGASKATEFAYNKLIASLVQHAVTVPTFYFTTKVDSNGMGDIFRTITPEAAPFFQRTPGIQAANEEAAQQSAADPEQVQLRNYIDSITAERLARASQAPAPTPCAGPWGTCGITHPLEDDIGYGYGQSTQFTQFFATVVQTSVPGFDTMTSSQRANSSVTVDIMSRRSDDTGGAGYRKLGQLASCTLANTCTSDDAVKVQTVAGSMVVSGSFPQWIAWTPPGAWLRVTARLHDGRTAVSYVDIPFRGESLPCNDYRVLTNVARSACEGVYDAMHYGAHLAWSETYQWGYRMSANGAMPWVSSNATTFDGRTSYPDQSGLGAGLPFTDDGAAYRSSTPP